MAKVDPTVRYDHLGAEICSRCKGSGHEPGENLVKQYVCCEEWAPNCGGGAGCSGPQVREVNWPQVCIGCGGDGLTEKGRAHKRKIGHLAAIGG